MRNIFTILLLLVTTYVTAQFDQQFGNIGDFKTENGKVIKDCKVGYRTVGKLNTEKTNAVLWPTWFTGTSEHVIGSMNNVMDTTGLYLIIVDALTNGISSSPSNTKEFPEVTMRDMVNSQYKLVTDHLNIDHLYAVMGISMGGMQTFEWLVAFPSFMDKAISIIGSPKQSSYDLLVWQTMADIITTAQKNKQDLDVALKLAENIEYINLYTPTYVVNKYPADSVDAYIGEGFTMKPLNVLGGLNAMISLDIYKSASSDIENISDVIKADLLVIVSKQDHLVNPISSTLLAEKLGAKLVTLTGDCGHIAVFCEAEKVKKAVTEFLKKN
jgi:homoserine O-acetyltransferase